MTASKYEVNSGGGSGADGGTRVVEAAVASSTSVTPSAATTVAATTPHTDQPQPSLMFQPHSPSSSSSASKNNGDSTFEPTVDMMVNDFDDEQTLEEEEALAAQEAEDPSAELSSLQKESDMPLEELLALYNCSGTDLAPHKKSTPAGGASHNSSTAHTASQRSGNKLSQSVVATAAVTTAPSVEPKLKRVATTTTTKKEETLSRENGTRGAAELDVEADDYDDDDEDDIKEISQLRELYPETYGASDKRLLRTISRQQSDDEEDGEYSPDEDEFKKTIMVGSEFQAVIPEGFFKYDDALPYENEDKLIWDPSRLAERDTEEYLLNALHAKRQPQQPQLQQHPPPPPPTQQQQQQQQPPQQQQQNGNSFILATGAGVDSLPVGAHLRDDEQALYLLLQCGHNTEEALRRKRINAVPSSEQMSSWSEDECRNFESGIRIYGKDFHTIQHTKVRTRSVGELVQFYYLWKKTERHDIFANKARLDKKKYNLHPGLTDYMDRFLEEQEGGSNGSNTAASMLTTNAAGTTTISMTLRDRSLSPGVQHSVTGGVGETADHRRRQRLGSTSTTSDGQCIPKDPLSIEEDEDEDDDDEDENNAGDDENLESSRTVSKSNAIVDSTTTISSTLSAGTIDAALSVGTTTSTTSAIISTNSSAPSTATTTASLSSVVAASDSSTMQRTVNQ